MDRAHPFDGLPIVLVSGQARSGTTVLTHALGAHPQICSNLKESSYVASVARLLKQNLQQDHIVRELIEPPAHFQTQFRIALLNILFPESQFQGTQNVATISTFSSLQVDMLDGLKLLFPKFLIVNIVRNGIEVVASRMAHKHLHKYSFENHCTAYRHAIDVAEWGEGRSEFLLVRHEDLFESASAKKVFAEAQERLKLQHSDACAEFVLGNQINSNFIASDPKQRKKELQKRTERWNDWTNEQKQMFKEICGATMDYFGYSIPR